MLSLGATVEAERVKTNTKPVTQVVITFPDAYVKRISTLAHTYDGDEYYAELMGDVPIEWSMSSKFDNASFAVANRDRGWTDLLNTYTAPEIAQATVEIYETFAGLADRQKIFSGKLDLPKDVNRKKLTLTSTQVLNNLAEQFGDLQFSPTCQWARKGLFANATIGRCPYDGGANYGGSAKLIGALDDSETSKAVTNGSLYAAGDYIQIDDEILYISDVTDDMLTFTRGAKGTTAAAHESLSDVIHQSCTGSYDNCVARDMAYRFGGLKFWPMSGPYFWREKIMWGFSRRIDKTWTSQANEGIFGNPWGVCYGECKVVATSLYSRDPGSYCVFFASLGCGPISGLINPPAALYPSLPPPAISPHILVNGVPYSSPGGLKGVDGLDSMRTWDSDNTDQGYDPLWANPPGPSPAVPVNETNGQTYSRMAYLAGTFASEVQTEESMPTIECWVRGREVRSYDSDGNYTGDYWTKNPAWIFVDMLINSEYGAGLSEDEIDFATCAATWNDYDAAGVEFNCFIQEKMPLADVLQMLCDSTRSYITYNNGKIGIKFIKSTQAATGLAFDASDIVADSCKYWTDGPHGRDVNFLTFDVQDPDYDYQSVPVTFADQDYIDALGGKKKSLSLKIAGITRKQQAFDVGCWHLNLCKMARRQDGAKKLTLCGSLGMSIQPGDIISVDSTAIDGYGATNYMVWSVKRVNNNGNRELSLIKWDTGLFEQYGVDYDTPFSGINPNLEPVPVENLTATVADVGDALCRVTISWTWPEASVPYPAPAKVYLFAGNRDDNIEQFELWTPAGVDRPLTSWSKIMPKAFAMLRVFAVAQSAFRVPAHPKVYYQPDGANATAINETLTATDFVITCDDASDLNVIADDFVVIPLLSANEILKVVSVIGEDLTVANNGSIRTAQWDTTAVPHADGDPIYKLKYSAPYADVSIVGHVQSIDYVRAYDYLTDASLSGNQLRIKIPRNTANGDAPKTLHWQLNASTPFPEPTADPQGAGDGYMEASFGTSFLVPTAYDMSAAVGKLLVIIDGDGEKTGRYITSVDTGVSWNGLTWKRANLNGYMPRMAGYYDWEVWSLWYQSCDHADQVTLTSEHLNLTENMYNVVVTWASNWTGYLRAYFLTDASISAGVIATDAVGGANTLLHLVSGTDAAAPSAPRNVSADHDGRTILVRWDAPASGTATLLRYRVRISEAAYVDDGDGTYSMSSYTETEIAAGVTTAAIEVEGPGQYAVAVLAENAVGISDYGIYWQEA